MTLACEGSATQALDTTRCGSFDFARRLASLRMTLHSLIGFEPSKSTTKLRTALGPGRPFMSRGCGLATDQKAVRRRGPGRVVLGSKPQLATTEKLVRWAAKLASWPTCEFSFAKHRSPYR